MRLASKAIIQISLLCLPLLGLPAEGELREKTKYDGQWWLSVSPKEQDGFVAGYYDCYKYEFKGPDRYRTRSFSEYERLITDYYSKDVSKQSLPFLKSCTYFEIGLAKRRLRVVNERRGGTDISTGSIGGR